MEEATFPSTPLWLYYPRDHIHEALDDMTDAQLRTAPLSIPKRWKKADVVKAVESAFFKAVEDLPPRLSALDIKDFFVQRVGQTVMAKIAYPPCPVLENAEPPPYFSFRQPLWSQFCTKSLIKNSMNGLHPDRRCRLPPGFDEMAAIYLESILQRTCMLSALTFDAVVSHIRCLEPEFEPPQSFTFADLIYHFLKLEYGPELIPHFMLCRSERRQEQTKDAKQASLQAEKAWWDEQDAAWPQLPDIMHSIAIVKKYYEASNIRYGHSCSVCSRKKLTDRLTVVAVPIFADEQYLLCDSLRLLSCKDPRFETHFQFDAPWDRLNGLMLDRKGMSIRYDGELLLNMCLKCQSYLQKGKVPLHAWANNLYRGPLADRFHQMSWLEEKACAAATSTAHVIRIFNSPREDAPKVFYGNVCAHDANIVDLATVLPRTPQDLNDCITVVFIGPERYKAECIKKLFYVRKPLMLDFLHYMKYETKHPDYVNIPISEENLALYPDEGELPGALAKVIHDTETPVSAFQQETAGPDAHPAEQLSNSPDDEPVIFLEKVGISDPDAQTGNAEVGAAFALRNLYAQKGTLSPDLVLQRGRDAIPEYHNPRLFPALFPTLFPYGTGGFEDATRPTPISFQEQANVYLDTVDRGCRYHHSFIFVVCNILQRRAGHLGTYFTVREDRFDAVAKRLIGIDEKVALSIADRMEKGQKLEKLNTAEQAVMELLKEVRTVAAKVPGSFAAKLRARTEIRNYMAFFNLPVFFFTANPNAVHSPMFQVMYGDETINLDERFPSVVAYNERARRLAHDPVAAADFFDVSFRLILEVLLGWDFDRKMSTKEGGLLGHVAAWIEMSELTARGGIHGHTIVCMRGSLNPSDLHKRMREDPAFEKRVCQYFESVHWHSLPDVPERDDVKDDVRSERVVPPPDVPFDFPMGALSYVDCFDNPNAFCARLEVAGHSALSRWWLEFLRDVKTCGEKLQRHTCRDVCFKYDHKECRFRFPHEVVPVTHFDKETNSLRIRVLDALVNHLNPFFLACTRHNHDIKPMPAGTTANATMYYVTDYITKMEEKTHYIISLMSRAVLAMKDATSGPTPPTPLASAKTLLHKCLSQLTSRQQIHAQQAVWYIRGNGDCMSSHDTVPMLSGSLIRFVNTLYPANETAKTFTTDIALHNERDDAAAFGEDQQASDLPMIEPSQREVRLVVDPETKEVKTSCQVENYYYRDEALQDVCFYDFVLRFRLQKKNGVKNGPRALTRFALRGAHQQKHTHEIVERDPNAAPTVPVVYGTSIPRSTADAERYALFVLAHFKPFSPDVPLIGHNQKWHEVLATFPLSDLGQRIVRNWDALYECEDEREQERQKKANQRRKATVAMHDTIVEQANLLLIDEMAAGQQASQSPLQNFLLGTTGSLLCSGGWITRSVAEFRFGRSSVSSNQLKMPEQSGVKLSPARLIAWTKELKEQEQAFLNGANPSVPVSDASASRVFQPSLRQSLQGSPGGTVVATLANEQVQETPAQISLRVADDATLNREQRRVYDIAANAYLNLLEQRRQGLNLPGHPDFYQLKMFVNGPGGTGKTYAIKTFQELMRQFRCGHRIKYTAPSGAAASLIQGVTLHSGLKIRVFKGKQKHGQYSITLTAQQKLELQNQFDQIDVLVVDEVSMVSPTLMAQIDASTRVAKNNDEPFGGLIVLFCGDFHQFPPVAALSLYDTIDDINRTKKSSAESKVQAKLGRMAWKTVDNVVELHQQERMKDDPRFGELVLRLRKGQCSQEDIDLLNSRVIRSYLNPEGIPVGPDTPLNDGIVIVATNEDRLLANYCKALVTSPDVVMCAARDFIDDQPVRCPLLRSYLLKLDMTKDIGRGALPPYVPVFRGMPVIMRRHNQAASIGVANGAQGILKDFEVDVDEHGYTYLKSSLVEFPHSQVNLSDLLPKHVPLAPWKHSFSTPIPGALTGRTESTLTTVVRYSTDWDPAFAITAHCAQGKTIDKVIGYINNGGPRAYVTVSRARRLRDLVLLNPVSMASINQPLKNSLLRETERVDALHHNTLVRYGYKQEPLREVPDPDATSGEASTSKVNYTWSIKGAAGKRKAQSDELPMESDVRSSKRRRAANDDSAVDATVGQPSISREALLGPILPIGCRWDKDNWSCAYDCLVAIMHAFLRSQNQLFISRIRSMSLEMNTLVDMFAQLNANSQSRLEETRECVRWLMNSRDPTSFPLTGEVLVSLERMFFTLTAQESRGIEAAVYTDCARCNTSAFISALEIRVLSIVSPQLLQSVESALVTCTQDWMDILIQQEVKPVFQALTQNTQRCHCGSPGTVRATLSGLPPLLYFEIHHTFMDLNEHKSLCLTMHEVSGLSTTTAGTLLVVSGSKNDGGSTMDESTVGRQSCAHFPLT